jgi:hypothetical protein
MSIEMPTFTFHRSFVAPVTAVVALFAWATCPEKVAAQIPEIPNWQLFWQ